MKKGKKIHIILLAVSFVIGISFFTTQIASAYSMPEKKISRTAANRVVSIKAYGAHSIEEKGYESFDSTSAIQKALDNGGTIYFESGTYNVTKKLTVKSNTTIYSNGATLNKNYNSYYDKYLIAPVANAQNITIRDITLNLKPSSKISNSNARGIGVLTKISNLKVLNVKFKNAVGDCIRVVSTEAQSRSISKNVQIIGCTVDMLENPTGAVFWMTNVDGFVVNNNSINRGKGQIWMKYCYNGEISNNEVLGVANYWSKWAHLGGIELYSGCDNILIKGNKVESNGNLNDPYIVGIRVKNSTNVDIDSNTVVWNNIASEAIDIRKDSTAPMIPVNFHVTNNYVTGSTDIAVRVISLTENTSINNVYVEKNLFEGKTIIFHKAKAIENTSYNRFHINFNRCAGISAWGYSNTGCEVKGNYIVTDGDPGITMRNAIDAVICDNTISSSRNMTYAIDFSYSKNSSLENNTVINSSLPYKSFRSTNATVDNLPAVDQ